MSKLTKVTWDNDVVVMQGDYDAFNHIYVVGDVHGMYDKLQSVMSQFTVNEDDLLIFLGDYIDRGPDSARCVEYVKNLCAAPNVVALMGNHEMMMINSIAEYGLDILEPDFPKKGSNIWLYNGGDKTRASFKRYEDMGNSKLELIKWILQRPHLVRLGDNIYFSHAGFDVHKKLKNCEIDDILWSREEFFDLYNGDDKWFVGHTPVQYLRNIGYDTDYDINSDDTGSKKRKPLIKGNITFLDTGSFMRNGCITCMEIKSGRIFQSSSESR